MLWTAAGKRTHAHHLRFRRASDLLHERVMSQRVMCAHSDFVKDGSKRCGECKQVKRSKVFVLVPCATPSSLGATAYCPSASPFIVNCHHSYAIACTGGLEATQTPSCAAHE